MNIRGTREVANIYILIDPRDNEVRYVGMTSDKIEGRRYGHVDEAAKSSGGTHKLHWIKQLIAAGLEPRVELVQTVPFEYWQEAEKYWIAYYKGLGCRLTNSTDGGDGTLGRSPTAEERARISTTLIKWYQTQRIAKLQVKLRARE